MGRRHRAALAALATTTTGPRIPGGVPEPGTGPGPADGGPARPALSPGLADSLSGGNAAAPGPVARRSRAAWRSGVYPGVHPRVRGDVLLDLLEVASDP